MYLNQGKVCKKTEVHKKQIMGSVLSGTKQESILYRSPAFASLFLSLSHVIEYYKLYQEE